MVVSRYVPALDNNHSRVEKLGVGDLGLFANQVHAAYDWFLAQCNQRGAEPWGRDNMPGTEMIV